MKLTTKAVFLIFLCLFGALAAPLTLVCFTLGLSLKRSGASTVITLDANPQGDPVGTPGGGGLRT